MTDPEVPGKGGRGFGVATEWGRLTAVLLHTPWPGLHRLDEPEQYLHAGPIDFPGLQEECRTLRRLYLERGIEVLTVDYRSVAPEHNNALYNLLYCRDLVFMTPAGAVLSAMAEPLRRNEVRYAERTLREAGVPILGRILPPGRLEGADSLWLHSSEVLLGVGARTNAEGAAQLEALLAPFSVEVTRVPFAGGPTQHLLGVLQLVAPDLALVRTEVTEAEVPRLLRDRGFEVVAVPEHPEVRSLQAMNLVTLAPRKVLLAANRPFTEKFLTEAGIEVSGTCPIEQLLRGAGGLACATAILAREA